MTLSNPMIQKQISRLFVIPFLIVFLSSCSSLSSMKFWGNGDLDIDEPRPLQVISNTKNIQTNWNYFFQEKTILVILYLHLVLITFFLLIPMVRLNHSAQVKEK